MLNLMMPQNESAPTAVKRSRIPQRIVLFLILPALLVFVGMKFYAQYRPVELYVVCNAATPTPEFVFTNQSKHDRDPLLKLTTPYDRASETILSMDEVRRLRRQINWSETISPLFDSLILLNSDHVLGRRTGKKFMLEYQFIKRGGDWEIGDIIRTPIPAGGDPCINTVIKEVASPDGKFVATAFLRDYGSSMGPSPQVYLRPSGEPVGRVGNVFVGARNTEIDLGWRSPAELVITTSAMRVRSEKSYRGITIGFRER